METLQEFTERMSRVEKKEEFSIGRPCQGNSRAIFEFEGEHCLLESFNYYRSTAQDREILPPVFFAIQAVAHPPRDRWINCRLIYGKARAEKMAKYYGQAGESYIEEDPYPREEGVWFALVFAEFEDMMRMVYDVFTGKFKALWGEESKTYESCIGYLS